MNGSKVAPVGIAVVMGAAVVIVLVSLLGSPPESPSATATTGTTGGRNESTGVARGTGSGSVTATTTGVNAGGTGVGSATGTGNSATTGTTGATGADPVAENPMLDLLSQIPEERALEVISNLTGLSLASFPEGIEGRALGRRLIEIAVEGFSEDAGKDAPGTVVFASSVQADGSPLGRSETFYAYDYRIHGFVSAKQTSRDVLVRWIHLDGPELVLLEHKSLAAGSDWLSFPHRMPEAWPLGRYGVTIFRLDVSVTALAHGTFNVVDLPSRGIETSSIEMSDGTEGRTDGVFIAGTKSVHARFRYAGDPGRRGLRSVLTRKDVLIQQAEYELMPQMTALAFHYDFGLEDDLVPGDYTVDLYLDGQLQERTEFTIQEE